MSTSVTGTAITFTWPDGTAVFDGLDLAVGPGRTGLIGANGSGKSTLLRLVAGALRPTAGTVSVAGSVGYLPQTLTLRADERVSDVLGVTAVRRALRAVESGHATDDDFATVGDRWDVEESSRAVLDRLGLTGVGLDRRIGELSGGETILLGLAAQLYGEPDVLLLDEPTNNLDLAARHRLYDAVSAWRKVLVVVSHDRELLALVDQIAELRDGRIAWYGGNFTAYEQAVAAEQEAAERAVRAAGSDLRRQRRELVEARVKLSRRRRYGQKMWDSKREPKIIMAERKRQAQVSAGKHRIMHEGKVFQARDRLIDAEAAVRDDDVIRVDLPATAVPNGRTVLTARGLRLAHGPAVELEVRGPERVALVGANGSGKTTLLRTVAGALDAAGGELTVGVPVRMLPQRLDLLDDTVSAAANVARLAPGTTDNAIRARLARFLVRGPAAERPVGTLSGGERFRATLAALLLAEPAPQLLMLDEPTNNLDLDSVRALSQALESYRGALLVASHDLPFLRTAGITRWLRLDGQLRPADPM